MDKVMHKKDAVEKIKAILKETPVEPDEVNGWFEQINSSRITETKSRKILLRPMVELDQLSDALPKLKEALSLFSKEEIEQASIQVKYDVYIEKGKESWLKE